LTRLLSPTRKLYWADAYRRRFTARVVERREGRRPAVALNRTLFYPTGGGQPHDTGRLGEARVLDVVEENGVIYHILDADPGHADELAGEIDWPRRWDHMQQHSGQHLLSAAFLTLLDRPTIGFHLSPDSVTIDLPGPPPDAQDAARVLDFVQAVMAEDRPIHSYQVDEEDIDAIPLRKKPAVSGRVRVVEIENLDWSACGGTHVRSTAQIGSLIITRLERRGANTRVHFLCGGRAHRDHRRRLDVTRRLMDILTTGLEDLPAAVEQRRDEALNVQKKLRRLEKRLMELEAAALLTQAKPIGRARFVERRVMSDDANAMQKLMRGLLAHENVVALLSWQGGQTRWSLGHSLGSDLDLRQLMPALRDIPGVRGGGGPDLIQGVAADQETIQQIKSHLLAWLAEAETSFHF